MITGSVRPPIVARQRDPRAASPWAAAAAGRLLRPAGSHDHAAPQRLRVLSVDGTPNALDAVRHVVDTHRLGNTLTVHLLNVPPTFRAQVARHVSREARDDFHREHADAALARVRPPLDAASVAYRMHTELGASISFFRNVFAGTHA